MRETVVLIIGGIVAFVLQFVLAPNISILGVMPNFVLAYIATVAMLRQSDFVVLMAFLLGLLTDLTGGGSLGVMAALFTLAAFIASRTAESMGHDTVAASLSISMMASLVVEICYALFYVTKVGVSIVDTFLLRALPCALYDCAVVLILIPLLSYLLERSAPSHTVPESSTVQLR